LMKAGNRMKTREEGIKERGWKSRVEDNLGEERKPGVCRMVWGWFRPMCLARTRSISGLVACWPRTPPRYHWPGQNLITIRQSIIYRNSRKTWWSDNGKYIIDRSEVMHDNICRTKRLVFNRSFIAWCLRGRNMGVTENSPPHPFLLRAIYPVCMHVQLHNSNLTPASNS
jgi:hypothetical protein